jgi:hypothetical protein
MRLVDPDQIVGIVQQRRKTRLLEEKRAIRQFSLESYPRIPLALILYELDVGCTRLGISL